MVVELKPLQGNDSWAAMEFILSDKIHGLFDPASDNFQILALVSSSGSVWRPRGVDLGDKNGHEFIGERRRRKEAE
jgi:hypothetical protein